jgi:hypothetical protein
VAKNTYQTQFTKENILAVKTIINKAINEYAENEVEGKKLDIFLILAGLGQAAYEVTIRTLPKDDADAKIHVDKMKVLVDKMITLIDTERPTIEAKPTAELLASIHLMSVIAEFYSRRRDDVLEKIVQDMAKTEGTDSPTKEE